MKISDKTQIDFNFDYFKNKNIFKKEVKMLWVDKTQLSLSETWWKK